MSNEHKGEVKLSYKGREIVLRPTFDAIAAIEGDTGRGIVETSMRLTRYQYGIDEIVAIIYHGAIAACPAIKPSRKDVADMVMDMGLLNSELMGPIRIFNRNILMGGQEPGKQEGES